MAYDNTNRGILSRNDRKQSDSHPDFQGQINVDGTDYWLSGWVKERNDGSGKFFSLSVRPKDQAQPKAKPKQEHQDSDIEDDIPF